MPARPKLAFCPIGKFVFSHEDALRYKRLLEAKLGAWDVDFVGLDGVIPDGLIRSHDHVEAAVRHFAGQGVDALFLPHCNFGTEGAAALIARDLGVPTLLWGPRDEAPLADGTRLRDSLCGLFATSKVLGKLGVPFSYIENCRLEEPAFEEGFKRFMAAANVVKRFRRMRIGQVGQRIDFFWTTIVNESELLERYQIEVLPLDMVEFIEATRQLVRDRHAQYEPSLPDCDSVSASRVIRTMSLCSTCWARATGCSSSSRRSAWTPSRCSLLCPSAMPLGAWWSSLAPSSPMRGCHLLARATSTGQSAR